MPWYLSQLLTVLVARAQWHVARSDECFMVLDIKPANMEDLAEVITCASFDTNACNLFAYSSSRGGACNILFTGETCS